MPHPQRRLFCGTFDALTADGRPDLVARDTAGKLYLYAGTAEGSFASRVLICGGWLGYNSLVVAGDLTSDGVADLLARDTAGVLWRYSGDGKGSFVTPRARLGSGWQMYTTLL